AVAAAVERDDAEVLREPVEHASGHPVAFDAGGEPVDEDNRFAPAGLHIADPDPIRIEELVLGGGLRPSAGLEQGDSDKYDEGEAGSRCALVLSPHASLLSRIIECNEAPVGCV